jgi:hypothetical protein
MPLRSRIGAPLSTGFGFVPSPPRRSWEALNSLLAPSSGEFKPTVTEGPAKRRATSDERRSCDQRERPYLHFGTHLGAEGQPGGHRTRARRTAHRAQPSPLPGPGAPHMRRAGQHQLRTGFSARLHWQQGGRPPPRPRAVNYLVQGAIKRSTGIDSPSACAARHLT